MYADYKSKAENSDSEDDEWPSLEKAASMDAATYSDHVEVNPDDEQAMAMFMNKNPPVR